MPSIDMLSSSLLSAVCNRTPRSLVHLHQRFDIVEADGGVASFGDALASLDVRACQAIIGQMGPIKLGQYGGACYAAHAC